MPEEQSQADKFKEAARDLECDRNEAKREDKLRKAMKQKPLEKHA